MYSEVFQELEFFRSPSTRNKIEVQERVPHSSKNIANHRFEMQKKRIEKGISIMDLSMKVQCDVETLVAYERGETTLSANVLEGIGKTLFARDH